MNTTWSDQLVLVHQVGPLSAADSCILRGHGQVLTSVVHFFNRRVVEHTAKLDVAEVTIRSTDALATSGRRPRSRRSY